MNSRVEKGISLAFALESQVKALHVEMKNVLKQITHLQLLLGDDRVLNSVKLKEICTQIKPEDLLKLFTDLSNDGVQYEGSFMQLFNDTAPTLTETW